MHTPASDFPALIADHAKRFGDRAALIDRERSLDFSALHRQSQALAAGLSAIGVRPDHRVALWLPNSAAWLLSFLACARLGALVFAVNTRFRAHEVEDLIVRGQVDWLVLWPDFKDIAFPAILSDVSAQGLARVKGIIRYDETAADAPAQPSDAVCGRPAYGFADLLRATARDDAVGAPDLRNRKSIVFTTSGTTSLPKFVVHVQQTLVVHGRAVASALTYDDTTCVLASTPFCGAFGFATLLGALVHGATVVSHPVFDPAEAMDAVRHHRVTHTFANNETIGKMLAETASAADFDSVRLFGFASFTPSMGALTAHAAERGLTLTGLYGSSELNALAAVQPLARDAADPLAASQHLPGGRLVHPDARVRAWDATRGVLPHGEIGEIQVLSPCVMAGYLDQPDATAKAFTADGYFRTGDVGETVDARHFIFHARLGDALRLSGFLVNPAEIEAVVDTLPGVATSQVVDVGDGKRVIAFVLLQPGAAVDEIAWKSLCKQRMAGFKVPARFVALPEFPTVASANAVKIQRARLREMAQAIVAASDHADV